MSKRSQKPAKATATVPTGYGPLLAELKSRVRAAQVKAALSVNRELIALYWDIGRVILQRQHAEGWGAKVVARLAADLQAEFPELKGFSRPNLLFMRAFAAAWSETPIVLQPVRQLAGSKLSQPVTESETATAEIVQQPVGQMAGAILQQTAAKFPELPPEPMASLPWGHNLVLLTKLKQPAERLWYAHAALRHGWSRAVLTVQIETKAHRRMGKAQTNFAQTLPPPQSDLAQQVLKDPYTFDFLTLSAAARERELEQGLTEHIQKFLVELGVGFAFVGRQVHLEVGGEDYYLDLLFYHLKLRCFVVLDLKMEAFKPEFAGKMNPVRYQTYEQVLLRLRSTKSQRRKLLCRRYRRLAIAGSATRGRRSAIYSPPSSFGIDLLRSVPVTTRCLQTREVSENCVGQALSQDAARKLSHGVNFYLTAVDEQMRHANDQPTIGLLLCKEKNRLTVEYALRDVKKPIGVAEWKTRLVESLPRQLRGALPSVEDLERGLAGDKS